MRILSLIALMLYAAFAFAQNPIKWEQGSNCVTAVDLGTTLAANTFQSADGATINNRTNLDTVAWLELTRSGSGDLFAGNLSATSPSVDVYMVQSGNGVAFQGNPNVRGSFGHMVVAVFPMAAQQVGGQNEYNVIGGITLPPHEFRFIVYNNTDQTMNNTWELNICSNNYEVQ